MPSSNQKKSPPTFHPLFFGALFLLFLFRLAFGLCSDIDFEDQRQIYLIGLKYFTTGAWPYFGADVGTRIQLPGALQGLVVGLPFKFWPAPEAPYVLLALLSFGGLCFLGWYLSRRLPQFPSWFLWGWVLTAPWALNWSTNIDNDSYMLFGSCLFFVGFMESLPPLTKKLLPSALAFALMGFGLAWDMQFHLSYVILFPLVLLALGWRWNQKTNLSVQLTDSFALLLGAALPLSLLVPTWIQYGLAQGSGNTAGAVAFNPQNFSSFFTVLFRYLALGCGEIPRFLGPNTASRMDFLRQNLWAAPFAVIAALLGLAQLLLILVGWFLPNARPDWKPVKTLTALTLFLIYFSFLFAIKTPAAHTYYLTLPLVLLYGFYALSPYVKTRWFLPLTTALLIANGVTHAALALEKLGTKSLYAHGNRELFQKAIDEKNYHLLGERRPETLY